MKTVVSPHSASQNRSVRQSRSGFTLIEVLVTVVILSVGIVLVLRSFEVALHALGQSKESIRADDAIASRITAMRLAGIRGEGSEVAGFAGGFSDDGRGFSGNCVVADRMRSADGSNTLYEIRVEVWRGASGRQYTAGTYLCVGN